MKRIVRQIKHANEECESATQRVSLWYRAIIGVGICIPLLYVAGFIVGALMLKNPIEAGVEVINGVF